MMDMDSKKIRFLARMGSRGVLGQVVLDMAEVGQEFFAISADLGEASGFARLIARYPERFINVGIAEQNLIGVSAGLSSNGIPVIATTWAMFATLRCADQLRNFLGYMQRNVKLVGMDSGMAQTRSSYSHANPQDLALMRTIPGLTVLSPCDGVEIYWAMQAAMETEGPFYIRLTGVKLLPIIYKEGNVPFIIGKAITLRQGENIAIIGCGAILSEALEAADSLEKSQGISSTVIDMHTIKPLDTEMLDTLMGYKMVVTVEEHSIIGGLGGAVAEYLSAKRKAPPILRLGAADVLPKAGSYDYGLTQYGLKASQLAEKILNMYQKLEGERC